MTSSRPVARQNAAGWAPALVPNVTVWRPALARGVLLRHDPVRDADLLLLPERVVVLHGRAGAVLARCDGSRTVAGIVAELSAEYPGAPVAAEVPDFLAGLRKEGWLT
ncbi:pyrroloquinoline quinone biosynthesis peptide chaperone PqqD [Streptomyces sp. Ag109_G2-15]|uniref:pyrroloquinoline quinone biosynthesis peptide chaperone PqqD n=1 Tax=Streptomyces sp. Ag109_G2-15 TaxID=1938850 RepID=UPI000BD1613D|nr:pyrroloquinoline quinone biosynthesis peptide chaperone PqqD [Streptomyces sp. Ag109_G2-15]SOE08009.1 pyrroloquinoline quinone biosynthesis protein D [Streptomyces sp. Ag109_G2-15]